MNHPLTPRQRELFTNLLADFLAEGFDSFTIDGATKRYHCSKSTMYALGSTRDAIIHRILVSYFKELARRTNIPASRFPNVTQALENYFTAITAALEPASAAFIRDLATEPVARDIYAINTKAATTFIHNLLKEGVRTGEFRPDDIEFVSMLIQRTMIDIQQRAYAETLSPAAAYRALGSIILHGISTHP